MSHEKRDPDWQAQLEAWVAPFLEALDHPAQRDWAPIYLAGLLGPGERKSVQPMAERVAPEDPWQLHHFVCTSPWPTAPLEAVLARKANALLGGRAAHLIVDDTALVKQGKCSVGVARQYCGELGKQANCQALVSLTLARGEVPVPVALRLYLPEAWAGDSVRRAKCGVPEALVFWPKWQIALDEIDGLRAAGVKFGDVLADVAYGTAAEFRGGLKERQLRYGVGILPAQKVYPADVKLLEPPTTGTGRPRKYPRPSCPSVSAEAMIARLGEGAWKRLSWRPGTRGELAAEFCAVRVKVADGALRAKGQRLPGAVEEWLVAERRTGGEIRYYLSNLSASATLLRLARQLKGRWSCEQAHEQMKQELGLDHFEGRSWNGLHYHALLTMIAFCFLQFLRLGGKKKGLKPGPPPQPSLPAVRRELIRMLAAQVSCPHCGKTFRLNPRE